MNNSSDNTVWQFSYGGFNGQVHLLIESVVVELFKCKGKMSPPQVSRATQRKSTFERSKVDLVQCDWSIKLSRAKMTIRFYTKMTVGF